MFLNANELLVIYLIFLDNDYRMTLKRQDLLSLMFLIKSLNQKLLIGLIIYNNSINFYKLNFFRKP